MFRGGRSKQTGAYAVDIGAAGLRVLRVEPRGTGVTATFAASDAWDAPGDVATHAFHERLGTQLAELLATQHAAPGRAMTCLPAAALRYKNIRLPDLPEAELANALKWEAGERLGATPGDPLSIRHCLAGSVRQGDEQRAEVIVMGGSAKLIETHAASLDDAGFEPVAIDAAPGALARVATFGQPADEPVLLIDIGESCTKVLIATPERIRFFKTIDTGLTQLKHALRQIDEAPAVLFDRDPSPDTARRVRHALQPITRELADEVALCLRYDSVTFRGTRPDRARLAGGGATLPGFAAALRDAATIEPVVFDPFEHINTRRVDDRLGPPEHRAAWTTAVGLALRNAPAATAAAPASRLALTDDATDTDRTADPAPRREAA